MCEYRAAIQDCLVRYSVMVREELQRVPLYISYKDLSALQSFIEEALVENTKEIPLNKLNRWLGYIQGVLIASRITDVETERNWTRPLFRPLDYPLP